MKKRSSIFLTFGFLINSLLYVAETQRPQAAVVRVGVGICGQAKARAEQAGRTITQSSVVVVAAAADEAGGSEEARVSWAAGKAGGRAGGGGRRVGRRAN